MSYNALFKSFTGDPAVSTVCPNCFLEFAIPKALSDAFFGERTKSHLYCPSCGKSMIPGGKSEAEKLRDELTREKQRVEQARAHADYLQRRVEVKTRQASAARGQVTRIKNRVKNGVCPACNRTFENLARHMASQHPHYCEAKQT